MVPWTLDSLAKQLREGKTSSRELVEQALARISDPAGEGVRAFITVDAEGARATAERYSWTRVAVRYRELLETVWREKEAERSR